MKTVRVKICGITSEKDLENAVAAGADAVGFVVNVPSSPRNISLEKAYELIRKVPVFVESVMVTIPENLDSLIRTYEKLKPTALQIHGEKLFNAEVMREKAFDAKLIAAINIGKNNNLTGKLNELLKFDAVLLDSSVSGKYGGTGVTHDWVLSKKYKELIYPKPLILAGGLSPENVRDAIRIVQPYAVDVSSGVESSPGVKDPEKIFNFIKNAKEAFYE